MNLRTKKSHFQNLPEGKPPKRILPRLFRFCYYLLLIAIVGAIAYILVSKVLFFTGRGQVEVQRVRISPLSGGVVQTINKQPGDHFNTGDILGQIRLEHPCEELDPDIRLTRLEYAVKQKEGRYEYFIDRISLLDAAGYEEDVLHRALEIGDALSRRKNEQVVDDIRRLREKAELLAADIRVQKEELELLERELAAAEETTCEYEVMEATFSGTIEHITRKTSEYINRGEPLFVVKKEEPEVIVEAYLDGGMLRYINPGEALEIRFPDKHVSTGIVMARESSGRTAVDRQTEAYVPVKAGLRVVLKPASEEDKELWLSYDRLDVRVKGEKK